VIASSVAASRVRFVLGLVLVTIGAGAFAVAFRMSLTAVYQMFYGADNIVDSIASLPRWLRLTVPVAAAAVAGSIARCIFVGRDRRRAVDWSRGTADRSRGGLGCEGGSNRQDIAQPDACTGWRGDCGRFRRGL